MSADLRAEIEAFLAETGMAPTRFGDLAVSDTTFVTRLRAGMRPRQRNIARIRAFMADYESPPSHRRAYVLSGAGRLSADRDPPIPRARVHRDPCFYCNVRGDLGCAHQRPNAGQTP